jgi:hypothetical protein
MPAYQKRSRISLLAVAPLLIEAARSQLGAQPDVAQAADAADAARRDLAAAVDGRVDAGADRSGAADRVAAAERGLDRRVAALRAALDGLAGLGLPDADALADALLPRGTEGLSRASGRMQVPAYEALARRLRAAAGGPGHARLEPALSELADDLELWCAEVLVRAEAEADLGAAARSAAAATEALRAALERLDLEVQRATGGARSPGYAAWADAARGVG